MKLKYVFLCLFLIIALGFMLYIASASPKQFAVCGTLRVNESIKTLEEKGWKILDIKGLNETSVLITYE